jgi:lactate dehydrogenase-like 2-hydroxyacid dehydrogenase
MTVQEHLSFFQEKNSINGPLIKKREMMYLLHKSFRRLPFVSFMSSAKGKKNSNVKVLFCEDHFLSSYLETKKILSQLDSSIEVTKCEPSQLHNEISNASAFLPLMTKVDKDLIDKAPHLKMIMQFGVGLEGIDIDYASKKKISVCKINSEICGNAQACSEHALFLTFSCLRKVKEIETSLKTRRIGFPTGLTLYQSKVLIYGFGGIGKQLLQRLLPMECSEITIVQRKKDESKLIEFESLFRFFPKTVVRLIDAEQFHSSATSDLSSMVVFICCNQNQDNLGLVNKQFISKFADPFYLINVARVSYMLSYFHILFSLSYIRVDCAIILIFWML